MKKFLLGNLLLFGSVAAFSQNLVNNDINVSFNNPGNYYSNVLSNGGGNSVLSNAALTNIPSINVNYSLDNNVQVQTIRTTQTRNVSRGNQSRQANVPLQTNTSNLNVINLETSPTNKIQVQKVPTTGSSPVVYSNSTSQKTISKNTTYKKVKNNFYTQTRTKVKHKRKPVFKKVKYHTSKCAVW